MKRLKPYFPSISLVLAQAQCLKDHHDSYSQKQTPKLLLPPVQDDLMVGRLCQLLMSELLG